VEEARGRTKQNMEEKRKRMKKEATAKGQDPNKVVVSFAIYLYSAPLYLKYLSKTFTHLPIS
jgi:hypothetical protein